MSFREKKAHQTKSQKTQETAISRVQIAATADHVTQHATSTSTATMQFNLRHDRNMMKLPHLLPTHFFFFFFLFDVSRFDPVNTIFIKFVVTPKIVNNHSLSLPMPLVPADVHRHAE